MVGEEWPTDGIDSSFYARHKVAVERQLDDLEREHPQLKVVRMRPALIFKAQAATEIRRLFVRAAAASRRGDQRLIPFVPDVERLRFQVVHSHDVGDAYRLAVVGEARGAFNLAAEPPLGPEELGEILHARRVRIPARGVEAGSGDILALRLNRQSRAGSTWP